MKNENEKEENMKSIFISVGGQNIMVDEPAEAISMILGSMTNLDLWSYDSLVSLYTGVIDFVNLYCTVRKGFLSGPRRAKFTRFINKSDKAKEFIPKDRIKLLEKLYNMILTGEGMNLCRGFGFSNVHKDKPKGNPEVTRLSKEHKE